MTKEDIKSDLILQCKEFITQRLLVSEKAIRDVSESRESESKSSVGDKYETGRAMLHMEEDKHKRQLSEARKVKMILDQVNPDRVLETIGFGSVILTDFGNYFISISAGRIIVEKEKYFAISVQTPLAQSLIGKKAGDKVNFNDKEIIIKDFF